MRERVRRWSPPVDSGRASWFQSNGRRARRQDTTRSRPRAPSWVVDGGSRYGRTGALGPGSQMLRSAFAPACRPPRPAVAPACHPPMAAVAPACQPARPAVAPACQPPRAAFAPACQGFWPVRGADGGAVVAALAGAAGAAIANAPAIAATAMKFVRVDMFRAPSVAVIGTQGWAMA